LVLRRLVDRRTHTPRFFFHLIISVENQACGWDWENLLLNPRAFGGANPLSTMTIWTRIARFLTQRKKCKETTGLHIMLAQLGDLDVRVQKSETKARTAPPVRFLLFLQLWYLSRGGNSGLEEPILEVDSSQCDTV
jgi:hypothetical protein